MKKFICLCLFTVLIAVVFSAVLPTYAVSEAEQRLVNVAGAAGITQTASIEDIVGTIINVVLGFIGVILVVLIVYAGFLWMTAAGDEKKVSKAKTILTDSIIGLVITLAAYAIAYFVVSRVIPATTG